MPLFLSAVPAPNIYVGYWSPYTLLVMVLMCFSGLILLIVLLLLALSGRLSTRLRQNPPPSEEDAGFTAYEQRSLTRSEKDARRKAAKAALLESTEDGAEDAPPQPPRRQTGWQFLVGAIGCSLFPPCIFSWIDNPLGRMRDFTFGAVLCVLLLAAQVFLLVRFILCQRRLGR